MKFSFIIIFFSIILSGCSTMDILKSKKNKEVSGNLINISYDNFIVNGVIKFSVKNQKISSRFNYIKNKNEETIEFIDLFNNKIVSFLIKKEAIQIKETKRNINSNDLEKIINKDIFKKVIINFSNILTGSINNPTFVKRYENGLYENIRNKNYEVFYDNYNNKNLPIVMRINFLNINFNLKIKKWELLK